MEKVIVKTEYAQTNEMNMFHIHLDAALLNARMDKQTLSRETNISMNYLSDMMEGNRTASIIDKMNISKAVGIPYDFLAIP